jgi:hypothetical protein
MASGMIVEAVRAIKTVRAIDTIRTIRLAGAIKAFGPVETCHSVTAPTVTYVPNIDALTNNIAFGVKTTFHTLASLGPIRED